MMLKGPIEIFYGVFILYRGKFAVIIDKNVFNSNI